MDGEGAGATATKGKGLKKWKRIQRRSCDGDGGGGVATSDLNPFSKRTPTVSAASDRRSGGGVSCSITIAPKLNTRVHRTTRSSSSSVETNNNNNNNEEIKKKPRAAGSHQLDSSSLESDFTSSNHNQSLLSLQDLHQSLQKEIQNFGEIGRETMLVPDVLTRRFLLNHETNSSGKVPFKGTGNSCSMAVEAELIDAHGDIYILKRKLEEITSMVEVKESRVFELEGILHDRGVSAEYLNVKSEEMESEVDDLFKAKIEAEVECLTMRKACQKLRVASEEDENASSSVGGQKSLVGEENSVLHKCRRDAENKNVVMKEEAEKLASSPFESLLVKMRGGIWKYTFCFSFQLVLVFGVLLFLQLWWPGGYNNNNNNNNTGFVPT